MAESVTSIRIAESSKQPCSNDVSPIYIFYLFIYFIGRLRAILFRSQVSENNDDLDNTDLKNLSSSSRGSFGIVRRAKFTKLFFYVSLLLLQRDIKGQKQRSFQADRSVSDLKVMRLHKIHSEESHTS